MTRLTKVSFHLFHFAALFVLLGVIGCGAPSRSGRAPSAPYQRGRAELAATGSAAPAEAPDRDADGIPDSSDKADEDRSGMVRGNEIAAPATTPAPAKPAPPADAKKAEPAAQPQAAQPGPGQQEQQPHDTAMLIYTAHLVMAVYQVDQGLAAVEKVARDMGGYLALKRDREIVIRVPRARFEPTLAAIDKIGDVLHRDVQAQDVTDEYVDLEIRIKNARAVQVRLKQLLEKAAVKEALEIEKELRRVTEELELLEGKLKLLKDKIAYSTITVTFEPRGSTIQATRIRLPFPWLDALGLPNLLQLQEAK